MNRSAYRVVTLSQLNVMMRCWRVSAKNDSGFKTAVIWRYLFFDNKSIAGLVVY